MIYKEDGLSKELLMKKGHLEVDMDSDGIIFIGVALRDEPCASGIRLRKETVKEVVKELQLYLDDDRVNLEDYMKVDREANEILLTREDWFELMNRAERIRDAQENFSLEEEEEIPGGWGDGRAVASKGGKNYYYSPERERSCECAKMLRKPLKEYADYPEWQGDW